uniref:Putative glutathione S-transferase n=1 Tax=Dermacentor variabilis TaxID=34621 RepID=B7SP57_DERVA|nr:putative glutathione S-transferase [Dermacentor variabilis]
MAVELYNATGSPPCTLRAGSWPTKVGVQLTLHELNLMAKEQLNPEFVKLNPQHTVPTLNDNGFVLWESRAIGMYLVEKYAPECSLYPKDVQKRATVNRMLFFESGTMLPAQMAYFRPKWFKGQEPTADLKEAYDKALATTVTLLGDKKFLCGDHVTLPDIGLACTLGVAIEGSEYEGLDKFPSSGVLQRFKKAFPEYDEVASEALQRIRDMVARAKSGKSPH